MQLIVSTPFPYDLKIVSDGGAIVRSDFVRRSQRKPLRPGDGLLREAARQVAAYFGRRLRRFDLPLALHGTAFQLDVWRVVAGLEFGEFVSYADVARGVGRPLAHRGVAMAMSRTPLDLFVPAHRVVGADGRIKGAAPGSVRRQLVQFERRTAVASQTRRS